MKIRFVQIFILLSLVGCSSQVSVNDSNNTPKNFDENKCQWLNDDWEIYQRRPEIEKDYCDKGIPCGRKRPTTSMTCEGGRIFGKTLLIYDSKRQKHFFADVTGQLTEKELFISFETNPECAVKYSFDTFNEDSMSGTFRLTGCEFDTYKEGRVFAKKGRERGRLVRLFASEAK